MKDGDLTRFRYNGGVFKKEGTPIALDVTAAVEAVKRKQGRPRDSNTKLIRWIDSKGKQSWSVDDYFKEYPECNQNRKLVIKQITRFIDLKRIIQIGKDRFRRNV